MKRMSSRELIKAIEAAGWTLDRVSGSHHAYVHPTLPGLIVVPHPKKDLGAGLTHKLLKIAGLK